MRGCQQLIMLIDQLAGGPSLGKKGITYDATILVNKRSTSCRFVQYLHNLVTSDQLATCIRALNPTR
jgi:hypothetical protein